MKRKATPCCGFCVEGNLIEIDKREDFDFFQHLEEDTLFLCLDRINCKSRCDALLPLEIHQPNIFVQLCCKQDISLCEVNETWKKVLDWLGASEEIIHHVKTHIIPNKQAWIYFGVYWPDPSQEELKTDLLLQIAHNQGEHICFPESNPNFAMENNIPNELLNILSFSTCVIAGSACLPPCFLKSDVDIWVLNTSKQNEIINQLRTLLKTTHTLYCFGQSVLTCRSKTYKTIQIIASNATNPAQLIRGFDMDCIRCFFDGTYIYHTVFSKYCQEKKICNVPFEGLKLQAYRVAKYYIKGFTLQKQEKDCLRNTIEYGWPLTKEKALDLERLRNAKNIVLELPDDECNLLPWGSSHYEGRIIPNVTPELFRGTVNEYIAFFYKKSPLQNEMAFFIRDVHTVIFSNFASIFSEWDVKVCNGNIFPKNIRTMKMQTMDPIYKELHNNLIQHVMPTAFYHLRCGFKKRHLLHSKKWEDKKYQDVLIYFKDANVFVNNMFYQKGLFGISIHQTMHVSMIPIWVNSDSCYIQWKAVDVFLVPPILTLPNPDI